MDIKYEIEPVFKIEFFKIKSVNFKNKKYDIEKILKQYPEKRFHNFYSNRNKCSINTEVKEVFKDEFSLIRAKYNSKIVLERTWSVIYFSNGYDLEKRLQSEDRAHRIGQKKSVTYVDLIVPKTVDEKIVKALRNKIDIASQVMGEDLKKWI